MNAAKEKKEEQLAFQVITSAKMVRSFRSKGRKSKFFIAKFYRRARTGLQAVNTVLMICLEDDMKMTVTKTTLLDSVKCRHEMIPTLKLSSNGQRE